MTLPNYFKNPLYVPPKESVMGPVAPTPVKPTSPPSSSVSSSGVSAASGGASSGVSKPSTPASVPIQGNMNDVHPPGIVSGDGYTRVTLGPGEGSTSSTTSSIQPDIESKKYYSKAIYDVAHYPEGTYVSFQGDEKLYTKQEALSKLDTLFGNANMTSYQTTYTTYPARKSEGIQPTNRQQTWGQNVSQAMGNIGKGMIFGNEKDPFVLAIPGEFPNWQTAYNAGAYKEVQSPKMFMAETYTNIGIGLTTGGIVRVAAPAAETSEGILRDIYRVSKVFGTGAMVTGAGIDIGQTAAQYRMGVISAAEVGSHSVQFGVDLASFGFGAGGKGFTEFKSPIEEQMVVPPQREVTPLYKLKNRILEGKNLNQYGSYNRGELVTSGGLKGFINDYFPETLKTYNELRSSDIKTWSKSDNIFRRPMSLDTVKKSGRIKTSIFDVVSTNKERFNDPFTEEQLTKEYYTKRFVMLNDETEPHISTHRQDMFPTLKNYLETYQGKTPDELTQNAKELQRLVRRGATWIQQKAVMKDQGNALKYLSIEGKNKPVLNKLSPLDRNIIISPESEPLLPDNMVLESDNMFVSKTTMKPSKKWEWMGENKMPVPSKEPIDILMGKVGKNKDILGLGDNVKVSTIDSSASSFPAMDEMGGFKKMYAKDTIMFQEEEPQISRRWENQFRRKPERQSARMNMNDFKQGFDFESMQGLGLGSILGHNLVNTQIGEQMNLSISKQGNLQRNVSIQNQRQSNISFNIQDNIQNQSVIQNQKIEQIQKQLQNNDIITRTITRTIPIHRNIIIKIPIPPPSGDASSGFDFNKRHKKRFGSKTKVFSLPIPTLRNLFGG